MGGSVGLAVMSTIAAGRTAGGTTPQALTDGYALAFRTSTAVLLAGAVLMLLWLPRPKRTEPAAPVPAQKAGNSSRR
ncbi:hypothetical protein GCM10020256_54680 [Streptomyces thermocoprophilus]